MGIFDCKQHVYLAVIYTTCLSTFFAVECWLLRQFAVKYPEHTWCLTAEKGEKSHRAMPSTSRTEADNDNSTKCWSVSCWLCNCSSTVELTWIIFVLQLALVLCDIVASWLVFVGNDASKQAVKALVYTFTVAIQIQLFCIPLLLLQRLRVTFVNSAFHMPDRRVREYQWAVVAVCVISIVGDFLYFLAEYTFSTIFLVSTTVGFILVYGLVTREFTSRLRALVVARQTVERKTSAEQQQSSEAPCVMSSFKLLRAQTLSYFERGDQPILIVATKHSLISVLLCLLVLLSAPLFTVTHMARFVCLKPKTIAVHVVLQAFGVGLMLCTYLTYARMSEQYNWLCNRCHLWMLKITLYQVKRESV